LVNISNLKQSLLRRLLKRADYATLDRCAMPTKHIVAAAILLCTLSGCATTGTENNSYATRAGIVPVRGSGINGY